MSSFSILNFGCRANQADGAALQKQMLDEGWQEASEPGNCDIALLNTCTVTATADAELRKVVRRIHRQNPECKILITGCYAQRAPTELAALDGVQWVVGNSHKHKIRQLLQKSSLKDSVAVPSQPLPLEGLQNQRLGFLDPTISPETPREKILVGNIFEQRNLMAEPVY